MRIRTIVILIIADALAVLPSWSQSSVSKVPEDTLAMVDTWPITTRDLFERLELMPFGAKLRDRDFEAIKKNAVESLVGERLLALAFKESEVLDPWHFDRVGRVLEKMLVRDEMYKREIRDWVQIAPQEIRDGIRMSAVKRTLLMIRCVSTEDARKVSHEWKQRRAAGETNASICTTMNRHADTVLISFGSADTSLERAAYALSDTVAVSVPVQTQLYRIVVISALRDEPNPESLEKSPGGRTEAVKEIISERKESVLVANFKKRVLRGKRMEADSGIFRLAARACWDLMRADSSARRVPAGYRLAQDDMLQMLSDLRKTLDSPIARWDSHALSLGDFLESLMYYDFTIPSLKPRAFMAYFFEMIKSMVEADIIAEEGMRQGYQYNERVIADELRWMDYWKSRYAGFAVVDTIHTFAWEPVWSLWRYQTALVESTCVFSIQEVLRPDSVSAANILRLIRHGGNLDSLARAESIRTEWRSKGGISGWFPFKDHPEIAVRALVMNIGEVTGPLRVDKRFSVFRLLGRKLVGDTVEIHKMLEIEATRIRLAHKQAAVNHFTAHQALAHRVEIYDSRIKDADIANINMFTRRLIGFGGKMNAAPVLLPQWEWVGEWQRKRQLNQ